MHDTLEDWITDLLDETTTARTSEAFQRWLDAQSRFHDYSARNALLISLQYPDATHVAGYRRWQTEFDRQVSEGESAIWIWAPITAKVCPTCGEPKASHDDDCESDGVPSTEWPTQLRSFKPVPVFDVSQTTGEPLPSLPTETYGDAVDLVSVLCAAADSLGVDVSLVSPSEWSHGAARGVCTFTRGQRPNIEVRQRPNEADMATTLVHEFAHGLLHADRTSLPERSLREVEAEAVAYLVGRQFGLDVSNSAFYLAAWADEEAESVLERLNRIRSVTASILGAVATQPHRVR
ncbi:ImmA/IrrE family metallo-endopeptidase [Haloferax sp. KTX1]|uniref:ImmA/IrrE family metallo-endopeptidase n=1 Tax=Haloferax sp. KTX1 TaxID=2600597 RepID=UPI0011DCCAFF|nr:ImmA/IrrE family metallo-endopeptidase [Haloferax sp. KTX1]